MKPLRQFAIIPSLPIELEPLRELALNLWWTWDYEAIRLFQHLDTALWEKTYHNPIHMLGIIPQQRLDALARDDAFLSHLNLVVRKFQDYMTATSPYEKHLRDTNLNQSFYRLFLGRIWTRGMFANLLRRIRYSRGRLPKVGKLSRIADGRCWAALPTRLLSPNPNLRRLADGGLPTE